MAAGPTRGHHSVKILTLSTATLAKIFSSAITNWNDDAIKKRGEPEAVCRRPRSGVYRKDESGTTDNSQVPPTRRPVTSGLRALQDMEGAEQGADKSAGIAQAVKSTRTRSYDESGPTLQRTASTWPPSMAEAVRCPS